MADAFMPRPGCGWLLAPTPVSIRRRYYAIALLYNLSASLIWGVNTLFLLDAGLDLFETFVANAFFAAGQVAFEIPTGVAADTVGRRFSFLASVVILAFATLGYVYLSTVGAGVVLFSAASVLLGLGFTFYSGAVEAWVVDALHSVGDDDVDSVLARGAQMFGVALIVGTVSGGLLGQIDLAWPYVVRTGLLVVLFGLAFWGMHDIGFERQAFRWRKVPREMRTILDASLRDGWRNPPVRIVMLITLLHMGFLIWGWYAWQPYFLDLLGRPDAVWVAGVIAAALGGVLVIGGQVAAKLGGRIRRSTGIAVAGALFSLAMVGTGLAGTFWSAVLVFLAGMAGFAVTEPLRQAALHNCVPSRTRATVVSFNSLVGSAGGVASQPALGAYTRAVGIGPGYIVGGIVTAPVVLLALMLRRHRRADRKGEVDAGVPPAPEGGIVARPHDRG